MIDPVDMTDEEFVTYLSTEMGYFFPKNLGDGRYAAIMPFFYTHAIIVGEIGDMTGYSDRWCYKSLTPAAIALAQWDGTGEPDGWHRHPTSGRRRVIDPQGERGPDGTLMPLGTEYVNL